MAPSHVVEALSAADFLRNHLEPGQPVVVRGSLNGWRVPPPWRLQDLKERFRDAEVSLFDTLFTLEEVATFGDYIDEHTGQGDAGIPPYLRWFTQQSHDQMIVADDAFAELADDWSMPSWLPEGDYLLPPAAGPVNASRDRFPARGMFVCGQGGRTRLHVDPWASDACLCQVTGRKRFIMYGPETGEFLTDSEGGTVDLDHPDESRFPRWKQAVPTLDEVLSPGDAIFIPQGWYHTAIALDDSVSLTWNFTHRVHEERFDTFLRSGGGEDPVISYFLGDVEKG
ncbi:cupin-like domain-containing protein [Streptomyces sp. WMMC897]|uniref:cupin-like domain-containing protein n=1 Tax=Streptomyces sp. WMMC897 TaxID=3014782 RepID=UPI0022B72147|nr:cupin-like domain-containing protein [Streptomyces sp. WMMC897]MCZ7412939.1 cupin-like domain-containing protein [Streptomyces sp. WMMC897]